MTDSELAPFSEGGAETIYALATPPGRSALAVVRISGPETCSTLESLTGSTGEPRHARLAVLRSPRGEAVDRALTLWFPAPRSETGEDMAELQLHGGPAVVASVVEVLGGLGLRQARPGEFARRAFANGKLDLTQAEGLADLVDAETEGQRQQALAQLQGGLKTLYEGWRERLVSAAALLEAEIDFPDEGDVPGETASGALGDLRRLRDEIAAHLEDGGRGERVRDGFAIAIIGPPNAGKSSILNRLARREAAIVTDIPGTTRDVLEITLRIGPYTAIVADTAGLRETRDQIEAEGVRRALGRASTADLRIGVADAGDPDSAHAVAERLQPGDIRVLNKRDLLDGSAAGVEEGLCDVVVSARTGEGFNDLETMISRVVMDRLAAREAPSLTRARHRDGEQRAAAALDRALASLGPGQGGPELAGEDVRLAMRSLEELTGRVDVEDVLDRVFSQFCIGK